MRRTKSSYWAALTGCHEASALSGVSGGTNSQLAKLSSSMLVDSHALLRFEFCASSESLLASNSSAFSPPPAALRAGCGCGQSGTELVAALETAPRAAEGIVDLFYVSQWIVKPRIALSMSESLGIRQPSLYNKADCIMIFKTRDLSRLARH